MAADARWEILKRNFYQNLLSILRNYFFFQALQFINKAGFVPMGSELHYAVTTKMLIGDYPKDRAEVNKMCPKVESGLFDSVVSGYGKRALLACEVLGIGIVDCYLKNDPTRNYLQMFEIRFEMMLSEF